MDQLRVGFIGTGRISDLHALGYRDHPQARIVAACDTDLDTARARGAAWGVPEDRIFADYADLLALPDVDLVEILLPHHLHHQATLEAFAAGKHVVVQKPMAVTLAQADEMIAAAQQAGRVLKVYENFIFYPPVQRAKALLEAGEIGDPLTLRIKSNAATSPTAWEIPASAWAWRFNPEQCGGGPLVFDDGHHKFSLTWFFMGLAEEVHAWIGATQLFPGFVLDSPAIVSFRFPGNRYGSLEVVYSGEMELDTQYYAQDDRIEITGSRGVLWVTRGHGRMLDVPPVVLYRDRQTQAFSDMPTGWEQSFFNSTRHFIDAFLNGQPPSLTGEQGRDILRLALAAQESARTGQAVRVRGDA
jgi:predicted dehydrogenase